MTGLWLPATKPKPWVGWRWMVTCRAEAGLRVPLSIPSWLSSNIAELKTQTFMTNRMNKYQEKKQGSLIVVNTCHMHFYVHPGPWPSPERREQHGTGSHCRAPLCFAIIHLQIRGEEEEDFDIFRCCFEKIGHFEEWRFSVQWGLRLDMDWGIGRL